MGDTRKELAYLTGHIKIHLLHAQEIGLEPPLLAERCMDYLNKGLQEEAQVGDKDLSFDTLNELKDFIGNCNRCKLSRERKNIVFGEGDPNARLVFVGEAPGMEEDLTGKPFVGAAGRLLTDIIRSMGLTRDRVYICNVVKCRPPRNRDPEPDEVNSCIPFLRAQISIIRPEVICTLGRISSQNLISRDFRIMRSRGQWHSYMGIPLLPTYHPAYLLRYSQAKREAWKDIQNIMDRLGLEDPRRSKNRRDE